MSIQFFAVRVETFRLVAAEIHDRAAAALLDAAQPVLLGTVEDLRRLAARLRRPLVTISCAPMRSAPAWNPPSVQALRPRPSQAACAAGAHAARGKALYGMAATAAEDRQPAVRVA